MMSDTRTAGSSGCNVRAGIVNTFCSGPRQIICKLSTRNSVLKIQALIS